jgi:glycosyltransferase involved in cell wall biosynthesis
MKVLLVHNTYQQPGGEDGVFVAERNLLRSGGHQVIEHVRDNQEIRDYGVWNKATLSFRTIWNLDSAKQLRDLLEREKPEVTHFHNTFPLISPAAYRECHAAGVPVVQTLHNYRLLCPAATFFRNGRVCEDCLGRFVAWPGLAHACYRNSYGATAAILGMLTVHRAIQTWNKQVDVYIALSDFARRKFVEGGLPPERVFVKPNFVHPDPGAKSVEGKYALYVGRLSEEKGIRVLLSAWSKFVPTVPLKIVGDGPLLEETLSLVTGGKLNQVDVVGRLAPENIIRLMRGALFLICPSVCFENFPLVIAEAFACGLPVIASRLGSMAEIVADGKTGLYFEAGDATDLASKVAWAWVHPEEMRAMGGGARSEYEAKYGAKRNYQQLMNIYGNAISARRAPGDLKCRDCK